jgi:hypothetical protein
MARVFINISNNHFQIDNFLCSLEEFTKIEPTFTLPKNAVEIEYNSEDGKRKYIKNDDESIAGIDKNFSKICESLIASLPIYTTTLATMRTLPALTLEEVKAEKIDEIKSARNTFQYSDISYQNTTFSANETVQFQIIGVLQGKKSTDSITWFDTSGKMMKWTASTLQMLKNAIETRTNAVYAQYYTLIAKVNASTTGDEINKITVSFS